LERYGNGIAKGMAVTLKHLFRHPVTTQYPEQKLIVSRRTRGNELIWQQEQCSGCSTCAKSCPQGVIKIETSGDGVTQAPCSVQCPAHINIPLYVRYVGEGKPAEAVAVIREKIPFPSVCGKVCFHPCETKCQRTQIDQPISIRVLKGFASQYDTGIWREKAKVAPPTGKKVAVVGSGPAGLTAAYYLSRLGHAVTVFEALPEAGGMMRVGIPDYRLPKDVLRKEIDEIKAVGVEIKTNTRVESVDELFNQGYQAIYLAVGAHEGMKLGVEGEDATGVIESATFLRESSLGRDVKVGKRVAVVGGGNVAIDAARVSLRLGAKEVSILYRRTRAEMPANPEEVTAAIDEKINMEYLTIPLKIMSKDGELQVECQRMQLGEPDASGRRRPEPIKGSEFTKSFDTIIGAIGQRPQVPKGFNVKVGRGGNIEADEKTLATARPGVYAGGDGMTGPASVIEAIAAGRQGAISIDKYLGGKGEIDEILAPLASKERPLDLSDKTVHRVHPDELPAEERVRSFVEVEQPLTDEMAMKEANRCLKCDLAYAVDKLGADMGYCIFCGLCVEACPRDALFLSYDYEKSCYRREELVMDKEKLLFSKDTPKNRSAFCRPYLAKELPEQTLLLDRDKIKK
jgi:NADPH-dependent glutamate synthase beta subunit-like oxidoreductase